ncbi:NAD(P)-dependent dehydrogenase, short-chain alcohol dehydrogenase family [Halopelagius inordinatus]|uniref:NAD(P)-dependent dehydrogenase, short-chain alcohol dehydrogenase family n=1 Tax=Halopelagius inordinatus TaxID=553467 RepID=A0A1I2M4U3_9EURY|nr:SDR family oxidoreductase [Halopelagius inordinatus]SFF84261.1 NAD(P)-dependent dehydrogenase, short-chain alcohol dehydrogenase family [Halopelagius inordinatus]
MLTPEIADRTVLVTGSSRGIGREIALAAAEAGAEVAVNYHTSEDAADDVVREATDVGAPAATAVQGDVTDPESVEETFAAVESELGTVDVLVNNVGSFAPSHWEEVPFETWRHVMATNFDGTVLCSRRALPAMREQGWGRIVNIGYAGSEKALVHPKNFPYFVAKTGVLMFTRMLANDTMDDGITVNAVSPYVVETSDEFPDDAPRGRWATVEDVAHAVMFFLDEDSGYVSGENVEIDGGWLPERL